MDTKLETDKLINDLIKFYEEFEKESLQEAKVELLKRGVDPKELVEKLKKKQEQWDRCYGV